MITGGMLLKQPHHPGPALLDSHSPLPSLLGCPRDCATAGETARSVGAGR
ncbi:hypothetical protein F750_6961 [Streptomyces sp. PAMC 26508]|nr:hypothetical protein F750_6961 [Streptomyces sp. PAMC 26508]